MRESDAFVLVFDVTNAKHSIEILEEFIEEIRKNKETDKLHAIYGSPIVIVRNKIDLEYDEKLVKELVQNLIDKWFDGKKLEKLKDISASEKQKIEQLLPPKCSKPIFILSSAKNRKNIDEIYEKAILEWVRIKNESEMLKIKKPTEKKGIFSSISTSEETKKDIEDFLG